MFSPQNLRSREEVRRRCFIPIVLLVYLFRFIFVGSASKNALKSARAVRGSSFLLVLLFGHSIFTRRRVNGAPLRRTICRASCNVTSQLLLSFVYFSASWRLALSFFFSSSFLLFITTQSCVHGIYSLGGRSIYSVPQL